MGTVTFCPYYVDDLAGFSPVQVNRFGSDSWWGGVLSQRLFESQRSSTEVGGRPTFRTLCPIPTAAFFTHIWGFVLGHLDHFADR